MRRYASQIGAHVVAVAIVLSLAADLLLKDHADTQQVLWSCYWGAVAVAVGIFIRVDCLVSSGFVFFVGLGMPAWILGQLARRETDPTSVLIHGLPPLAAALYLCHRRALPRYSAPLAWMLHTVPLALAWLFCDPAKNINLAHAAWLPLSRFLPRLWQFHALILATSAVTLTLAASGINYVLRIRGQSRLESAEFRPGLHRFPSSSSASLHLVKAKVSPTLPRVSRNDRKERKEAS